MRLIQSKVLLRCSRENFSVLPVGMPDTFCGAVEHIMTGVVTRENSAAVYYPLRCFLEWLLFSIEI